MKDLNSRHVSKCPALIADYQKHLRCVDQKRMPFSAFCRKHNVKPAIADQWMRRHGTSVACLRYEAILEGYTTNSGVKENDPPSVSLCVKGDQVLKGVSVTFCDGTIVNIRHAPASELSKFMDFYNKTNDKNYVQPE